MTEEARSAGIEGPSWEGSAVEPPEAWPDLGAVALAFGLRAENLDLEPVSRAWSNRVFKLSAGGEQFALKELRNAWDNPRWQDWTDVSFEFERQAIAAGVAAPQPVLTLEGSYLAWVARSGFEGLAPVRLHRWVDGSPCPSGPVAFSVADWAGEVLATLHGLGVQPADRSLFPTPNTDSADRWEDLVAEATRRRHPVAAGLADLANHVRLSAEFAREGLARPGIEVMSHGDIDQKNVVLTSVGPVLCDWDLAAPWVPARELVDVALSLGSNRDFEVARRVVRAYEATVGSPVDIDVADLAPSLMIGLDWVVFNIERWIGARRCTPTEREQSGRLVPDLLAGYKRAVELAEGVPALLADG